MSLVTEHHLSCDLLVAGGGMAGVCCALAAARLGAQVILVQDRPVLGGNASSEIRMHIVGATGLHAGIPLVLEPREGGLIEEIRLETTVRNPQRSPAMFDLQLYELCRAEPSLTLLLNTTVTAARVRDGRITDLTAERPSTEDRFFISAMMFADCTGDGRLGVEAGAPFLRGREGRGDYGESLAPEQGDAKTLGSTLLFQARRHDRPMPYVAPPWVRKFRPEDFLHRPFGRAGSTDLGLEYGYWWIEWGGCLDTLKDNERIRDELLAITLGVWNHIKNDSGLDVAHWALEWVGFVPGKRESRRFVGQHVLTEGDLLGSRRFADAIAYGGWPIDTHPPEGVDAPREAPCTQHHLPWLYDIPLRSCVASTLRNLFFAGRNLSATHLAFASTRVMATCAAVGQGVGTAAALALRAKVEPAAIAGDPALVARIQQRLLQDDAYLLGVVNEDDADLARRATVRASSEQPGGEAALLLSGQTRAVHGPATPPPAAAGNQWENVLRELETGHAEACYTSAPPDRARPGTHRWMSSPAAGLPAWLELHWEQPIPARDVQLVFDTGLHRFLTLSQADGYTRRMHWGTPQPETVRDYRIEAADASGAWHLLHSERDNHQRRRVHRLARTPLTLTALRLTIEATHGLDHARVCEVRVYG